MCYPKPGPRCTSYAQKRLTRAQEAVACASTETQQHLAMFELVEAEKQFYITTGGLEYLQSKIDNGEDPNNQYLLKLRSAEKERRDRLGMLRAIEDAKYREEEEPEERHQTTDTSGNMLKLDKSADLPSARYLDSIAPLSDFHAAIDGKLVTAVAHRDAEVPYVSLNYTNDTQYLRAWNQVTNNCRGLIVNKDTGEIIARPFTKFFNDQEEAGEHNDFPRTGPVLVSDKLDGSMGISYQRPDGTTAIATRGSMNSDQAKRASALYAEKYEGKWKPRPDTTYLYEIIYPENQVVLDYGDKDDIVLIGAVDKNTGRSIPATELTEWPGEHAQQYEYASYEEAVSAPIADDKEGMVIHFTDSDKRVKLKGEHYKNLHKIKSTTTPRSVWEAMQDGRYDSWAASMPDEFSDSIGAYSEKLRQRYSSITEKLETEASTVRQRFAVKDGEEFPRNRRKEMATYVQKTYPKSMASRIMSCVSRGKVPSGLSQSIWRDVRPGPEETL